MSALFTCGEAPIGRHGTPRARGPFPTVDIHCHVLCQEAEHLAALHGVAASGTLQFASDSSRAAARAQRQAILPKLTDIDTRLRDMDAAGIDMQVLSPAPNQYYYEAEAEAGRLLARCVNESIAGMAAHASGRFVGLGTVPLQDVRLAQEELRYAVQKLGLKGVEIGTHVAGVDLDAAALEPFFALAEELGVLLFMHPAGFTEGRRLADYFLNNIIGNPLESTIALSRLIFCGLFERRAGLKLCVAHGGGYLASYPGRMDHAWRARPECRACLQALPSESLKKVYFDTLVFEPGQLRALIETFGADHLLLGTDYPYDMGDESAVALIGTMKALDEDQRAMLLGGNASRLLALAHTHEH